ncbi:hypothetical protein ABZY20_21455 [Streptomyces sp. NPDC006624]|uniref:Rv1733c family protein n=1 Tax=Streptomyces sp. NPDC006624 TaxID=3154892 RepID=UPI0033A29052
MRTSRTVRRSRLWRWRRNPLRRREDVLEAWILLAVWLVVAVAGPVAGVLSARATVDSLAQRRAERQAVTATLVRDTSDPFTGGGTVGDRVVGTVRWTARDGAARTGETQVPTGAKAGEEVVVWTDRQGRLAPEPQSPGEADIEAAFMGAASFAAVAAAAAAGFYGAHVVLERRRGRAWDEDWQKADSQWGRATS